MHGWTSRDSLELYSVPAWGRGFFTIDRRGNLVVQPRGAGGDRLVVEEDRLDRAAGLRLAAAH